MSANLDLVRSIHADWERGDFSRAEWADPEIEFVVAEGPDAGRHTGVAAMAKAYGDFLSAFEGYRYMADKYRQLDDGRVLVSGRMAGGRGKASGLGVAPGVQPQPGANLFQVCDGKVKSIVMYFDRDRAFADLGLTPEGDAA